MKRGRPFEPGNALGRGRPRGSRNKRALLIQELLDQSAQPLLQKALAMALEGDSQIIRSLLGYILPQPKDPPVKTGLLRMGTIEELSQSHERLVKKVASGELTPNQAQQIDSLIASRHRVIETQDIERRLRKVEQALNTDLDKAA